MGGTNCIRTNCIQRNGAMALAKKGVAGYERSPSVVCVKQTLDAFCDLS